MKRSSATEKLAKMLYYLLGRHPEEFGLVPDPEGWVKIRDLLRALSEEPDWRHVRASHINEVLLARYDPPVEVADGCIRARDRSRLPAPLPAPHLPKLL
jgi:putative RNA 2'-phosphotransferase